MRDERNVGLIELRISSDPNAKESRIVISRRREIGSFYSPQTYATALVKWALDDKPGSVLDPSYGGCVFLRAALAEIQSNGHAHPGPEVYGTDIDPETKAWTAELLQSGVPESNLLSRDFLAIEPDRDIPRVSAVVGNPPYVRHHWLSEDAINSARAAMRRAGIQLSGRANLWAYFVIHASRFVRPGGRLAMLLPGSVVTADYSSMVRESLSQAFGRVTLLRVHERIFPDAAEETVVLLASEAGHQGGSVSVGYIRDIAELEQNLTSWHSSTPNRDNLSRLQEASSHNLDRPARKILDRLLTRSDITTVGEFAEVRLGTVTGANDIFVCSDTEIKRFDLIEHAVPVVTRSAWLTSSSFTENDLKSLSHRGEKTNLLVIPKEWRLDRRTRFGRRVTAAESAGTHLRHHTKREPWWSIPAPKIPTAFLPYMSGGFRGAALNQASATSTNTVHQLNWKPGIPSDMAAHAIRSTWSTLTALSAELVGRGSGGGMLKLEISDARQLLAVSTIDSSDFEDVNGNFPLQLRHITDMAIARRLNISADEMQTLRNNLGHLVERRLPLRRTTKPA